ncbi:hypothetical protein HZY62_15425 [Maribacter polysiphoniae]|uniref:Uncharacterized protein n=1 Tax=Maribacter polysiphoniae TaxID=429344 RepID=A0A316DW51_9FLAO|nr:hypothetical protein [Maribacter polysiphoniae]MBD1261992.1 hypothetical protein [Maribacter polysiphoniae]PWK21678.1 hypothetical protein LX92_03457 [Maribacter polysiphoniae]
MAELRLKIKAELPVDASGKQITAQSELQAIVSYSRIVRVGGVDDDNTTIPDEVGLNERQFSLLKELSTEALIEDYSAETTVTLVIADSQGSKLLSFSKKMPTKERGSDVWNLNVEIAQELTKRIIESSTPKPPVVTDVMSAKAEFRPTIERKIFYKNYSLVVSTVEFRNLSQIKRKKYFGSADLDTSSAPLTVGANSLLSDINAASVNSISVNLQGQFDFTIQKQANDDAWVWILSGPQSFAGIVAFHPEKVAFRRVLWLPFDEKQFAEEEDANNAEVNGNEIPVDASEQEILNSPELFSDDPGTRCKPFSSPHRIVGERSFQTVLRVTQPEISSDAAAPKPPSARDLARIYEIDQSEYVYAAATTKTGDIGGTSGRGARLGNIRLSAISTNVLANLTSAAKAVSSLVTSKTKVTTQTTAEKILGEARAEIMRQPQGRRLLTSNRVLDWEDDTPAQAASLSYGHILEYRVRWRNNGYSLGNVLYSLPLAPRQTKQIVTVTSEITDSARRIESTTASEEIAQGTTREYGYTDAVQAGLSEWSKGGSKSKQTGVAGGFGAVLGPVVLGGGASHGTAQSSSWQEGGRNVSAIEQQSLRDAIRQYGESVRKLETVVIQEQTQEETTQAVSEVVRNPNYCHTLTIVYHEILRHLRVDTEVVGARECIFVPLPIKPFTINRMIRWRDSLTNVLMRPRLRWVMPYLEDVRDNFQNSEIAANRRADQPVTYISGSIYLRMAVDRPLDPEDENVFEKARWIALYPFVNRPIREIFDRLNRNKDQKDQIFQSDYAPSVARKWIDKIIIKINGGATLDGVDMTMASKYRYGQSFRVDFTCVPTVSLTRANLTNLKIVGDADYPLTIGSIANVERVSIRYTTNDFSRNVSSNKSAMDLIDVDTGNVDTEGADVSLPLNDWEKKHQRDIISTQVELLKKHLNEHLEHYHKHLWWNMDRDKLYMLLDTIYAVSEEDGRSVASVVERNPIAVMGNNLVYKVAGGAHLKINGHDTAQALNEYYVDSVPSGEPIRVSLPTAGVYAQALLDDCEACEEHFGSTEWILDDKEQELASLDPSMLSSRRSVIPDLTPSQMPASIINLQNAPNVPAPSGLSGTLDAITKAGVFGDMAGLEGTQANSKAAMDSAAQLATTFGAQAAEIRKQEIAAKVAKEKISVVKKAVDKGGYSPEAASEKIDKILDEMTDNKSNNRESSSELELLDKVNETGVNYSRNSPNGDNVSLSPGGIANLSEQLTGDESGLVLANFVTNQLSRWGAFGKEMKSLIDQSKARAIIVNTLRKSPTFQSKARTLGQRYRSFITDLEKVPLEKLENGTYTGKKFLQVIPGDTAGGYFIQGDGQFGYTDTIVYGSFNQSDFLTKSVPSLAHEVCHAIRAAKRQSASNLGAAIVDGVNEEIAVRIDEAKILREVDPKNKIGYNLQPEIHPGRVEREVAPGIGLSYLENIATGFKLSEAASKDGLDYSKQQDLRIAADSVFPSQPADTSDYSKAYFMKSKLINSWEEFHSATKRTDLDYETKRNQKIDEHVHNVMNSAVMYRSAF